MYSIQGLSDTVIPEVDSLTWSLSIEKCCIPESLLGTMRRCGRAHPPTMVIQSGHWSKWCGYPWGAFCQVLQSKASKVKAMWRVSVPRIFTSQSLGWLNGTHRGDPVRSICKYPPLIKHGTEIPVSSMIVPFPIFSLFEKPQNLHLVREMFPPTLQWPWRSSSATHLCLPKTWPVAERGRQLGKGTIKGTIQQP